MNPFLGYFSRWVLATLVVLGAIHRSESFSFTQKPPRIVRVVEETRKILKWDFTASASKYFVIISRQRPGETDAEQIATRSESSSFSYVKNSYYKEYTASRPATLLLKDVQRDEEYDYTLSILDETSVQQLSDRVTVEVVVPPKIIIAPVREPQLNSGQNYTLKCNASDDPHPNITWTKDGVPVNQFNASGYFLQLVNVQRKDAGSYRCTASNGYGDNATSFSIVGIKCTSNDCTIWRIGMTIRSVSLRSAFSNQTSPEFKNLESKLLSAIWSVYTKNPDKQLYRADVDRFGSENVFAIVELLFGNSATDPLKPLQDEINDGNLGSFIVDRTLDENPTTAGTPEPPDRGARGSSGLTNSEMWGIIGGCIVLFLLIGIIVICCFGFRWWWTAITRKT